MTNSGWGGFDQSVATGVDWGSPEGDKTVYAIDLTPKQIDLELAVDDDKIVIVPATQIGYLAVHPHLKMWGQWQVTHEPTLSYFMKALPNGDNNNYSEYQLIEWCKKVQSNLSKQCFDDWAKLATLTENTYRDVHWQIQHVKDRIQQHCLAIEV